jgi:hypothetical protein
MSVSAAIITDVRANTLLVPNSAVKQRAGAATVEVVEPSLAVASDGNAARGVLLMAPPQTRSVTVGLSNDTVTEVLDGLRENDRVVVRTIAVDAAQSTPARSGFQMFGIPGSRGPLPGGMRR